MLGLDVIWKNIFTMIGSPGILSLRVYCHIVLVSLVGQHQVIYTLDGISLILLSECSSRMYLFYIRETVILVN